MTSQPQISLITSLYRSEAHLEHYIKQVTACLAAIDLHLQIVIVANNATSQEQDLLTPWVEDYADHIKLIHCERESLYASWNRGIAAADADYLGFWNVDDQRTVAGLRTGYALLSTTADLVDFAYTINKQDTFQHYLPEYLPDSVAPKTTTSPFFMFRRSLYQRAGSFNPHFKILGDYEWCKRAVVRDANFSASDVIGGTFVLHGNNLSGSRHPLEAVEYNIAFLIHGVPHYLRPAAPALMRQTWEAWGQDYATMTPAQATFLWGDGAHRRFKRYRWERNLPTPVRHLFLALAKRRLLYSLDWQLNHPA